VVGNKAISRAATAGALAAFAAVLLIMDDSAMPSWTHSVGGGLSRLLLACVAFFVAYVLLLITGMGLLRGERIKRFNLRSAEFEFADEAEGLKEIDIRLSTDMKALNDLITDLAVRVDEIDDRLDAPQPTPTLEGER
jgi:hypothetical protein